MRSDVRIPWCSLMLAAAAVVVFPSPLLQQWLQYDRHAVAAGELWRAVTCHWTHWSTEHLVWDVGMFGLLATVAELRSRRVMLATLAASAVLIPAMLWHLLEVIEFYRGLSGLDAGLFCLVVFRSASDSITRRHWRRLASAAVLLAGFAGKISYEMASDGAVFVHTGGFVPVPVAHLAGATVGCIVAAISTINLFPAVRYCVASRRPRTLPFCRSLRSTQAHGQRLRNRRTGRFRGSLWPAS